MLLKSAWKARLGEGASPSERLAAAMAADILDGKIETGGRLPAHRDLAFQLGIGVGAVTRAYAVLERRGLVRSVKGRGTFVAAVRGRGASVIDLGQNTPPAMLSERVLGQTLRRLSHRIDPSMLTAYPPPAGHDEHRRLMAAWCADLGVTAEAERLILCNGAQQALSLVFRLLAKDTMIVTEAFTYPGAIALMNDNDYRSVGIWLDRDGMLPDELEKVLCVKQGPKPKVVYVTPTMHNPTTATMTLARREEIVAVCRRYDAWIVEDDVYALSAANDVPALVNLAPERTFYINGLSKTLSPGLRLGALLVPRPFIVKAEATIRASGLFASPLSCAVMGEWLASGIAHSMRASVREEAKRRRSLALSMLGDAVETPLHDGFHLWIPMSRPSADQIATAAAALGVNVTSPDSVTVDAGNNASGIRLCLGGPSLVDLSTGLIGIAGLLGRLRYSTPHIHPVA